MTFDLGISSKADQSGADRSPCAFGQGHAGEGFGDPGAGGHQLGCGVLWYCSRSEANCPVRIGQAIHPGAPGAVSGNAEQVVAVTLLHGHQGVACHLVCQAVLCLAGDGGQGHGHRSVAVERIVVGRGGRCQPTPVGIRTPPVDPVPTGARWQRRRRSSLPASG